MGWVRVDLYNFIHMFQHNPNPSREYKLTPLLTPLCESDVALPRQFPIKICLTPWGPEVDLKPIWDCIRK
jgi:hypothetical protein